MKHTTATVHHYRIRGGSMSWNDKAKPAFLNSPRCRSGYVPAPKEAWLKTQVDLIAVLWRKRHWLRPVAVITSDLR